MGLTNNQKEIADQFLALIKKEGLQWTKMWRQPLAPCNGVRGNTYNGMNYLTCAMRMLQNGWTDPRFITMNAARKLGLSVKGQKATPILYIGEFKYENEEGEEKSRLGGRVYNVWNVQQLGAEDHTGLIPIVAATPPSETARNARIERFIRQAGINIKKDFRAYYNERLDQIGIPDPSDFLSSPDRSASENYYSVLLHEVVHWTGAVKRLNRQTMKDYHFDTITRAKEELIAEIGSVFFGNHFGIQTEPSKENAAYVQNWIKLLEYDKEAVFVAAKEANKALTYCMAFDEVQKSAA